MTSRTNRDEVDNQSTRIPQSYHLASSFFDHPNVNVVDRFNRMAVRYLHDRSCSESRVFKLAYRTCGSSEYDIPSDSYPEVFRGVDHFLNKDRSLQFLKGSIAGNGMGAEEFLCYFPMFFELWIFVWQLR